MLARKNGGQLGNIHKNVPNEIVFATISPTDGIEKDQTNPAVVGRATRRNSQLRCSVVLLVDGLLILLLACGALIFHLFRRKYVLAAAFTSISLGASLVFTGSAGIFAARRRRKSLSAVICAVSSSLSSAGLFISFIIMVKTYNFITDPDWPSSDVKYTILVISIIAFLIGITVCIILLSVQLKIYLCFGRDVKEVTQEYQCPTTSPLILITDEEKQLAMSQNGETRDEGHSRSDEEPARDKAVLPTISPNDIVIPATKYTRLRMI